MEELAKAIEKSNRWDEQETPHEGIRGCTQISNEKPHIHLQRRKLQATQRRSNRSVDRWRCGKLVHGLVGQRAKGEIKWSKNTNRAVFEIRRWWEHGDTASRRSKRLPKWWSREGNNGESKGNCKLDSPKYTGKSRLSIEPRGRKDAYPRY